MLIMLMEILLKVFQKKLGIVFNENLNFIDTISDRFDAPGAMSFAIRTAKYFDVDVCLKLFDPFVLPKLGYMYYLISSVCLPEFIE